MNLLEYTPSHLENEKLNQNNKANISNFIEVKFTTILAYPQN